MTSMVTTEITQVESSDVEDCPPVVNNVDDCSPIVNNDEECPPIVNNDEECPPIVNNDEECPPIVNNGEECPPTVNKVKIVVNEPSNAQFSSDSDESFTEDLRFGTPEEDISVEAVEKLKELWINNKLEIIQRKVDSKEVNQQIVCHSIADREPNDLEDNGIKDENSRYLFECRTSYLIELELKAKQWAEQNKKKKIKTDIQFNRIPKTFEEFLQIIFDLKAELIGENDSDIVFPEETQYREIRFQSHESYANSFIPFVIREMWTALKTNWKPDSIPYKMTYEKNSTNEIKCTHIRDKSCGKSMFKFGQIVSIQYSVAQMEDPNQTEIETRFGVVLDVMPQVLNKTIEQLTHPLIKSQTETEENEFLFEQIFIYCNPFEDNFETVLITPLMSVQKYLLEARIVYELKEQKYEKILEQILKPNFNYGISGLSVSLENRKDLFDVQKDAIQKAYEICCLPQMGNFSSFVAIYGPNKSGKTEVLKETALQLLKTAEENIDKLLIITTETDDITGIIETLKKNEIKVFHIDSDGNCLSHKSTDIRRQLKKMNKQNVFDDIVGKELSFDQCLKYYSNELQLNDLSIGDQYFKELSDKRVNDKLVRDCQVIIGSIDSVMNDELFNSMFNKSDENNIRSALIDNANQLTETELLTLLFSGVRSFALFGDNQRYNKTSRSYEPFLCRYVERYSKDFVLNDSKNSSVIYLRDSIESLQRFAKNRERNQDMRANNRLGGQSRQKKLNQYQRHSNYGSEYFNRFQNKRPFKTETNVKSEEQKTIVPNKAEHTFGAHDIRLNQYQSPQNQMIGGIVSQVSVFGNQQINSNQTSGYFNVATDPAIGGSNTNGANSDPNANFFRNVSNPTRHQNFNLF